MSLCPSLAASENLGGSTCSLLLGPSLIVCVYLGDGHVLVSDTPLLKSTDSVLVPGCGGRWFYLLHLKGLLSNILLEW